MKLSVYKPKLLNKAASTVYENHIANEQIRSDVQTETKGVLSSKEVADIICLYIYGATNKDISKLFGVKAASGVYLRDCYRDVQIPFQTMKEKEIRWNGVHLWQKFGWEILQQSSRWSQTYN